MSNDNQDHKKESLEGEKPFEEDKQSEDEGWEDENPDDEEEGIIIHDGMEIEFDDNGDIIGLNQVGNESVNTDMGSVVEATKQERSPCVTGSFAHHLEEVVALSVNPLNDNELVTGGMDDQLVFWDVASREPTKTLKFQETVAFVDFGFDGKIVAAGTLDDKIRIFERSGSDWTQKFELTSTSDELTVT